MKHFIAIDAGASKTEVLIANENQQVLSRDKGEGCSLTAMDISQARANLEQILKKVLKALPGRIKFFDDLVMGLAGFDTLAEERLVQEHFYPIFEHYHVKKYQVVNDSLIALKSGTDHSDAVVLIAGTGSNCFGFNSQGQTAKASGLDYLLSDFGSAYEMGSKILKVAAQSFDGSGPQTVLEKKLCQHFGVTNILELKAKIYHPPLSKSQIASLSKLADQAVEESDEVAQKLIKQSVDSLVQILNTVLQKLDLVEKNFDLVIAGGLSKQKQIKHHLVKQIQAKYQQVNLIMPQDPPVFGALKLAISGDLHQ